jgi:hypothetical protein
MEKKWKRKRNKENNKKALISEKKKWDLLLASEGSFKDLSPQFS